MNSTIFRDIPKANNFKIPFALKENLLLEWLLGLSKERSREACSLILQFLQTLNKTELSVKNRILFLKASHEYFRQYMNNLDGMCWDASLPLSTKEQDYAETVVWHYLTLSEGFFIAAENANARTDEMFALYMSCYCLGQAQLYTAAIYKKPNKFFWHLTYKVFLWAEKHKVLEAKINDDDLKYIKLNDLFAQIFIFNSCDTNQFRPRDMLTIFNFLPKVCGDFAVYKLADMKFQTEILKMPYLQAITNSLSHSTKNIVEKLNDRQDLFVFDVNDKVSPVVFNSMYVFDTPSVRYFSAAKIVEKLELILEKGDMWSGILKSINHELFARVIKTLEHRKKRKHTRSQAKFAMLGVVGFENIVSFLYKVNRKNKLVKDEIELANPTTYEELTAYAHKTKPQMGAIDGGFFEIDFDYQSTRENTIWASNTEIDISNRVVSLKKISVFDTSAHGYSVYWNEDYNAKTKVGDIFGVISDDKKRLEVAIIRRIAMFSEGEGEYRFGTEVLGFESELVMITHADNQRGAAWGIFIPGIKTFKQEDTIIYPIGNFQNGDFIYIYKSNKKIKAAITKELNATSAIAHVEVDCSFFS